MWIFMNETLNCNPDGLASVTVTDDDEETKEEGEAPEGGENGQKGEGNLFSLHAHAPPPPFSPLDPFLP